MGKVRFSGPIYSGGMPLFGGVGYGMDDASTIYFVDKKMGSDGYNGKEPVKAFKTIEKALAVVNAWDVVYVMDPGTSASDPLTYSGATANYTIKVANKGLALIGVAHGSLVKNGRPISPSIYAYQAATPVITVNAPLVTIENFRFQGGYDCGGVETAGIWAGDFSEGVKEGYGLSVDNCYFEDLNSVGDLGAIAITGQWNGTITNCTFMNCEMGISIVSSGSTIVGTVIEHVKFLSRDGLGTKIKCDIYVYAQGETGILINDVFCGHDVPIATGTKGACIAFAGGAETGLCSNIYFMDNNATAHATTGTGWRGPATLGLCHAYTGQDALITK